jgi:hypothetical protein
VAGLLMMPPPAKGRSVASTSWPERTVYLEDLLRLAERAAFDRRPVATPNRSAVTQLPAAPPVGLFLALPLGPGAEPIAVAAVALAAGSPATLMADAIADQLRWGAGWLEALPWAHAVQETSVDVARAASCMDLLAVVGEHPGLKGMTVALVNDLAGRLRCDRVSIGLIRRNGAIRLRAMSHSANFKRQGRLVDAIENAMEEALDQRASLAYPELPATARGVCMAQRALAEIIRVADASLLTVVMRDAHDQPIGAITFERHGSGRFDDATLRLAEAVAGLLGPIISLHGRTDRLIAGRLVDRFGEGASALLGPRRPALKLAAIGIASLALFLGWAEGMHRVTARAFLEGEVQRAVVTPFDGFLRTAPARAGDTVRRGDLLADLDDRDLLLERTKWRVEREKLLQKQREVRAKHDRINLVILDSLLRQAESQLSLAQEKLARAQIVAPFDGIVVSGDLSQTLGSPVEKGKLLFEVAPLDAYRLVVQVDERDVRFVAVGQSGTVAFAGMPWNPLPMTVSKIMPVTVAEEGHNSFRIEARLTDAGTELRPGMEGVAKIEIGQRSLAWIWSRTVVDWLRLAAWKYLP